MEPDMDFERNDANGAFWAIQQTWERAPPKYVRNAYIYFCQANFGRFARILNTRMPQCILRASGQAWRTMQPSDKEPYVNMYKQDLVRYRDIKEKWMAEYRGRPPKYRKRNKYATTWLPFTPPKRYRTVFIWYHAVMRPKMRERYPNWDGPELVQEIASTWRKLSEEEKEPYKQMARKDTERYLNEMRQFRKAVFQQEAFSRVRNIQARLAVMRQRYHMNKDKRRPEPQQRAQEEPADREQEP